MDDVPVLPWGNVPNYGSNELVDTIDADVPATLALSNASRIEVKWEIESGSDAETATCIKWWGAALVGKVTDKHDGEGRQCYQLRYDAEEGFEEEVRTVTFLDEHTLYDLADDDELLWRREGEGWDAEPEGEEGAQTVHLGEMAAAIEQAERRRGRTYEEDCLDLVKDLPGDQQRYMISGFAEYAERLALGIQELSQSKGPDYVVTEADVRHITQKAKQQYKEKAAGVLP